MKRVRREVPGIRTYDSPAGGWGALRATARAVREQMDVVEAPLLLYRTNKPTGFDCPGCAWPDKEHTSTYDPQQFAASVCSILNVFSILVWSNSQ